MAKIQRRLRASNSKAYKFAVGKSTKSGSGSFFRSVIGAGPAHDSASGDIFFQPVLATSQPGDKFEREADSIADKVSAGQTAELIVRQGGISQVQKKDLQEQPGLKQQSKEEEKVQVQKAVEKEEEKPVQMQAEEKEPIHAQLEEEETAQKKADKEDNDTVQAQQEDDKETVQAKSIPGRSGWAGLVSAQLGNHKGKGEALPSQTRQDMEASFGTSFEGVKIHTDSAAVQMNKAIGAKAFAHGKDLYFNSGNFEPHSRNGRHLLAHELTHAVQQTGSADNHLSENVSSAPKQSTLRE